MGDVWAELLRLGRLVASCKPDFRAVNLRRSRPQPFVGCDVCTEEPKTPDAYDVSGVFFLRWFACFRAQVVSVVVASEGRVALNGTAPRNRDRPVFGCRNSYYD